MRSDVNGVSALEFWRTGTYFARASPSLCARLERFTLKWVCESLFLPVTRTLAGAPRMLFLGRPLTSLAVVVGLDCGRWRALPSLGLRPRFVRASLLP